MKPAPTGPMVGRALMLLLGASLAGCGLEPRARLTPNRPPEVKLDRPRTALRDEARHSYALSWRATDPDGRVDHFLVATDPRSVDEVDESWSRTEETAASVSFSRAVAVGRLGTTDAPEREPHVVAVRAVDDRGAMSAPAAVAFFGSNIAPEVRIVEPINTFFEPVFVTSVGLDIRWEGTDQDGQVTKYKYRLFDESNPDFPGIPNFIQFIQTYPDSFRSLYAPAFAGWDSVGPETHTLRYAGLAQNKLYAFVITAFDDAGDYDPVFSDSKNVLRFLLTPGDGFGPQICVRTPYFDFCTVSFGPTDYVAEFPADVPIPVSWSATAWPGSSVQDYRWVLDPKDPEDEGHRSETSDPHHWTPWSPEITSTTLGPLPSRSYERGEHVLWVQARDNFERASTFRVHFTIVRATFEKDLLIVDDTRLTPDQKNPDGTYKPPVGTWPNAAELDTFLYARGGYPWIGRPPGTSSPPGLLNGYDFDTLGTRGLMGGLVPLSTLSRYRHVIWLTDDVGATYVGSPQEMLQPITSLRLSSSPGYSSSLAPYVQAGGSLWLGGGGAAYATLAAWGRRNTPVDDWTNNDLELVPGRFMYDFTHWRSAVAARRGSLALIHTPDLAPWPHASLGRGWSGHGPDRTLSQPSYARLIGNPIMSVLRGRTCASDPPTPPRTCNIFPFTTYAAEVIGRSPPNAAPPNFVREDADPRPNHERIESTLDTLYLAYGASVPSPLPVMTYYHGFESGPVVFSGFPPWYFQRTQAQALVDFVLQDIWGLTRQGGAAPAAVASRRR